MVWLFLQIWSGAKQAGKGIVLLWETSLSWKLQRYVRCLAKQDLLLRAAEGESSEQGFDLHSFTSPNMDMSDADRWDLP